MKAPIKLICYLCLAPPIVWALPNPASANCVKQGGTLEIREAAGQGQYGVCVWTIDISDEEEIGPSALRSECEEWAFYRGQCLKNECEQWVIDKDEKEKPRSYCAKKTEH